MPYLIEIASGLVVSAIAAYVAIRVKLASLESHMLAKFVALDEHIELLRLDSKQLAERIDSVIGSL